MKRAYVTLSLILVLLLAAPVLAASPYTVWINNNPYSPELIWKDDKIYVPVRLIAENLNCDVKWTGEQVEITTKQAYPNFVGDEKFKDVCTRAMELLKDKDPAHYKMICDNVTNCLIYEGEGQFEHENASGYVLASCLGNFIIVNPQFIDDEKRFTPQYVAGVLVHEAAHASYNRLGEKTLSPAENERMAYGHELLAFDLIGAPKWIIDENKRGLATTQ